MNKSIKNILVVVFVLAVVSACSSKAEDKGKKKVEHQTPALKVVPAVKAKASYTLQLPAEIKPYEQVDLYPKMTGFIKSLHADIGDNVKKGDLLAELEAPEITEQYLSQLAKQREALAKLSYSSQSYKRLKKAASHSGAVAPIELEQALSKVKMDSSTYLAISSEVKGASALRSYLKIIAPFDGVIVSRNISEGALVGSKELPLFTIAQRNKLRLVISIPEKHSFSLNDSTKIKFTVSNHPGQEFHAKLSRSGKVIQSKNRAVVAEFDVDNRNGILNGGEFAQAKLNLTRSDSSIWVPKSSVVNSQSGVFVLKLKDGKVVRVPIIEGISKDSTMEVFGELNLKDSIVLKGSEELIEGMEVAVK